MEEHERLYEMLKKIQEPKGYFFNNDRPLVYHLIKGLIKNRKRYGYMGCPCRLCCSDRDKDKDIICPCVYRKPDVEEFGACYCALYVSKEWNEGKMEKGYVPERRPDEKLQF